MWLSEKKGSHTNLLAKQFHQAFYWRVGFVKDILSDSFISRFRIRIHMLVWNLFILHVCAPLFHKILHTLCASWFEISSRLLIFSSKHKRVLAVHGPALPSYKILHPQMKRWLGRSDKKSRVHPAPRSALWLEIARWKTEFCLLWNVRVVLQSISEGFHSFSLLHH